MASKALKKFLKYHGEEFCLYDANVGDVAYYAMQCQASYETSDHKESPKEQPPRKITLTTTVKEERTSITVSDRDLRWEEDNIDKKRPYLLLIWNCTDINVTAKALKYTIGCSLYDPKKSTWGKIVDIPPNPEQEWKMGDSEQFVPTYTVEFLKKRQVVTESVVGSYGLVAVAKIWSWYKCIRHNRAVRIIESACKEASLHGPGTLINQSVRNGSASDVRSITCQHPNWKINDKNWMTGKTALREAVEHHNCDVVTFLIGLGADPNCRDGTNEDFILYAALRDTTPGGVTITRHLLSFIETKADPDDIPFSSNEVASSDGKRFWLETSRSRKPYSKDFMAEIGAPHLPRYIFSLVGQPYAKWKIIKDISLTLSNQEKYHRMVFVLGGKPGHGKTMAAQELSKVLSGSDADFLKVSCANVNSVHELFGSSGAFRGSEVGSELNNFVVDHSDRMGVVNLDEFDRLESTVRDGLFTIFDKGEWVNKKLGLKSQTITLDCKKIIWVLTTNVFDEKIGHFYEEEEKSFHGRQWNGIERKTKKGFRGAFSETFGDAMSRRLGSLIPFVRFTKEERIAFVEDEIDKLRLMYAKPAVKKDDEGKNVRIVGGFNFSLDPDVVNFIADEEHYDEYMGATSITDFIKEEITDRFTELCIDGEDLNGTSGHFSLTGRKGSKEITFEWYE